MHLGAGAVEAEAIKALVRQLLLQQRRKQPREHARLGPAARPHVDRAPLAAALRKGAPLAAVLQDMRQGVDDDDVGISALPRWTGGWGCSKAQRSSAMLAMIGDCSLVFSFVDNSLPQTRS